MALENVFYFNFKVLSRLPNRNKARKLLKFAVFDIFLSSQIVCCSDVRYMYILNQNANYYTFIKLLLDVKLFVTIWMESNIALFTKVQSGLLTWGLSPLLSLAYPVIDSLIELHHWRSTTFLLGGRYFLLLIFEDIYNMYQ